MKLYRTELDKGIHKKLFDIDVAQFHSDELNFYENSIKGEISADRITAGFHIRGRLDIPFELICDRCLEKYHDFKKVKINFLLTEEQELYKDDSNDVVFFSQNEDEIDLKSIFRELILLERQMKNICKEDCKGLCSNCGTNLNMSNCKCFSDTKDNPWTILKNLKDI